MSPVDRTGGADPDPSEGEWLRADMDPDDPGSQGYSPPATETRELAITFGGKYAREPHEEGHLWVHPDGWLTVQYAVTEDGPAVCRERARTMAWRYLQGHYAFDYDMDDLRPELYPRGELARMVLP